MIDPLQSVLITACLLLGVMAAVQVAQGRPAGNLLIGSAGAIEVGLVVQAALGIVQAFDAPPGVSLVTFICYLLAAPVVVPAGVFWAIGDRSRGGTAVLVVAGLATAFLVIRLNQIWTG